MKILIGFSGGKDSQACLIWAVRKYGAENCEAIFNDTKWEHPITYHHIERICSQLGVKLKILTSKKYDGFEGIVRHKKIFPQARIKFCTVDLKITPTTDYILSHSQDIVLIEGVRRQESTRRAQMKSQGNYFEHYFPKQPGMRPVGDYRKKDVMTWMGKYKANYVRPVFNWSTKEVFKYIKDAGTIPHPLYSMGFNRIGCFPCFFCTKKEIMQIINYFPEKWEKIKKLEHEINNSFFTPSYVPEYARLSKTKKGVSICRAIDVENYLKSRFGHNMPRLFNLSKVNITPDSINQLAWLVFENKQNRNEATYGRIVEIKNNVITWKEEYTPNKQKIDIGIIKLFKIIE